MNLSFRSLFIDVAFILTAIAAADDSSVDSSVDSSEASVISDSLALSASDTAIRPLWPTTVTPSRFSPTLWNSLTCFSTIFAFVKIDIVSIATTSTNAPVTMTIRSIPDICFILYNSSAKNAATGSFPVCPPWLLFSLPC